MLNVNVNNVNNNDHTLLQDLVTFHLSLITSVLWIFYTEQLPTKSNPQPYIEQQVRNILLIWTKLLLFIIIITFI